MPPIDYQMTGRWLLAGWLAAVMLFVGAPSVDLAISGLFFRAGAGFTVIGNPFWEFLRQRIWDVAIIVFLFSIFAAWRAAQRGQPVLGLRARIWGYVAALYLVAPILLVNLFLKAHSGRARPANVQEFGGERLFTPAGVFTDQCASNCSFVSGEVSAAVVLGLALWLAAGLWRGRIAGWAVAYLRVVALIIPAFIILQRVSTGRHFSSDAIFAALMTLTLAWGLHAVFSGALGRWLSGGLALPRRRS